MIEYSPHLCVTCWKVLSYLLLSAKFMFAQCDCNFSKHLIPSFGNSSIKLLLCTSMFACKSFLLAFFSWYSITPSPPLLYYPKIGGNGVNKDYAKKAIRKILHEKIYVHSRRLIAEFPKDEVKCIEKLQSHCASMTFSDKSRYDRTFQQDTHKGG